jgi:hypothetical protein
MEWKGAPEMQRKAALFIVVCAALVAALACGPLGGGGEPTPVPPTVPPPAEGKPTPEQPPQEEPTSAPALDLTGEWMSPEWGALWLEQEGDLVTGTYEYHDGQIRGTLIGNRLEFRWWEFVPGQPYEAADPGARGDAYFDVLADGNHIEGEWRYEGDADWVSIWTAVRQ